MTWERITQGLFMHSMNKIILVDEWCCAPLGLGKSMNCPVENWKYILREFILWTSVSNLYNNKERKWKQPSKQIQFQQSTAETVLSVSLLENRLCLIETCGPCSSQVFIVSRANTTEFRWGLVSCYYSVDILIITVSVMLIHCNMTHPYNRHNRGMVPGIPVVSFSALRRYRTYFPLDAVSIAS